MFQEGPETCVRAIVRSRLQVILMAALNVVFVFVSCGDSQPKGPPNILFVFTDDHAAHAISSYGSRINLTPNIDRLARGGMLFRNAFVTNSICAPSRAVILTGRHSHLNGVFTNREEFDGSQPTFPKLLQQAGYQTAIIGKWHLKSEPTGFDHWEVLPGQGDYYNPEFRTSQGLVKTEGYVTDIITDKALDWLEKGRDPTRPFMLLYWHKAPHRSWEPGPDHLTLYGDREIPEPPTLFDNYEGRASPAGMQEMTIDRHMYLGYDLKVRPADSGSEDESAPSGREVYERMNAEQRQAWDRAYGPRNEAFRLAGPTGPDLVRWKYQRYIKDYLRCVASVDDNLGRVLDSLDRMGLTENTMVVYSSDQGFFLGDHGWYDKRWMYEESLRIPLIVRWPGVVKSNAEDRHLVQNLDFAETFLDAAGLKPPPEMQGRSLVPLLRGESPEDWRDAIYYQYFEYPGPHSVRRHRGVRTDRLKLIHYYETDEWELFDLDKDPEEMKSVYGDPAYDLAVQKLKDRLEQLRRQYAVPEVDPVPYPES